MGLRFFNEIKIVVEWFITEFFAQSFMWFISKKFQRWKVGRNRFLGWIFWGQETSLNLIDRLPGDQHSKYACLTSTNVDQ